MREDVAAKFDNPKCILAFNKYKRFVALFGSYNECERLTGIKHQMIRNVCKGKTITTNGFYFRELSDEVNIEDTDLYNLTLLEYDQEVLHEDRIVYRNGLLKLPTIRESQMTSLNMY